MGTASEIATPRHLGLLVAAIKPPETRIVLLAGFECSAHIDDREYGLSCNQYPGAVFPAGYRCLQEFSASEFARWKLTEDDCEIWGSVATHRGDNAPIIRFDNKGHQVVNLRLRPHVWRSTMVTSRALPGGCPWRARSVAKALRALSD